MKGQIDRPLLTGNDRPVVEECHVEAPRSDRLGQVMNERCAAGGQPQAAFFGEMRPGNQLGLAGDRPPRRVERFESVDQHS